MKRTALITYIWSINMVVQLLITGCYSVTQIDEPIDFITMTVSPLPTTTLTATAIPTSSKTPLPINTLTALERENFVRESLSSSSDCNLPCWWGITPGETTWEETQQLLIYLGVRIGSSSGYDSKAVFHGTGGFDFMGMSIMNRFSFEEHNGIVDGILIKSEGYNDPEEFQTLWANYSPKSILKTYGIPDRVLLNITESYALSRGYHLWLFYDRLGFMILYPGGVSDTSVLKVCPVRETMLSINLNLQDPNSLLPLERFDGILEIIRIQTEVDTGTIQALYSIEEATGMNEKEFHDLFMKEDELICFETPSDIWDIKQ